LVSTLRYLFRVDLIPRLYSCILLAKMIIQDIERAYFDSPIGRIEISCVENAIISISFIAEGAAISEITHKPILGRCIKELTEYFDGIRTQFDIPLLPVGTEFEKQVWKSLSDIPFGETCSYIDIANRMNNPGAVRAVGRANGANPIAIVIPCHRVVGADGSLTGYSGELWRKRRLLDHEARIVGSILL
jgi:methylated-DNA-[protein]-cysteine S-methyltransferase